MSTSQRFTKRPFIIDEAPQGAAALYHAIALRSCYGRVAAHEVELSDYAEPSQTFGAMPIVVVGWKIIKVSVRIRWIFLMPNDRTVEDRTE